MDIDKLNEDFDSNLANNNSKTTDDNKTDSRSTNQSNKKLKTTKVDDGISKGKTMTGSKPDEITINPVIESAEKTAVMSFVRMNPPTTGHHKLIKKVESEANKAGGSAHIILSHSTGSTKNPLSPQDKKGYVKQLSQPSTHVETSSAEAPSILHHASRLNHHSHHLVVVAGQDRVKGFHDILHKYNGVEGPHGKYNFKSIKVVSAGQRDPDAEGTKGISGTKMREHANNGNVRAFKQGLPKELHNHAEEMIKKIQKVKDVEPIKKKKLKEELFAAFESEMDISEKGLNALKEKAFKSGIKYESIFDQYTIGYIDNLLTSNGKMTNEQAGFASVNSYIANSLFEQVESVESIDNIFEADAMRYGKWREVESRSGQKRKDIDLVVRNGEDRNVDDRPYRQQSIQKQVIEGERGLWDNIHAKQERIKNGSGEKMRKPGSKGAPTKQDLVRSQNEAKDKGEYDYEGDMAQSQLRSIMHNAQQIHDMLKPNTNMPEWVQSKITLAEDYISTCFNYLNSNGKDLGEDFYGAVVPSPLIHNKPTMIKKKKKVDESFLNETEAWQKKAGKNPEGGLNRKGIQSYRNAHPGSKLSMAVTKEPSELKVGSKSANRRKSFCARMGGMKSKLTSSKTARDPDSRINKALRKWHCN